MVLEVEGRRLVGWSKQIKREGKKTISWSEMILLTALQCTALHCTVLYYLFHSMKQPANYNCLPYYSVCYRVIC